jgi:hypothetical protein
LTISVRNRSNNEETFIDFHISREPERARCRAAGA